jgi:DNA-binding NarL/FixJ family response regulator
MRFRYRTLQADIEVVAEATNGREAVAAAAEHHPDVVLMDVRMPELDGIAATRAVTAVDDPPRVLVLTTFDLDEVSTTRCGPARRGSCSRTPPRSG